MAKTTPPRIRAIRADNPSPLTGTGTNTWIIGSGRVALIDPGPALPAHLDAILATLEKGEVVSRILVTHAHRDHSALARPLSDRTGAPILAYGTATSGRSAVMERLVDQGFADNGEGADMDFAPDTQLQDGDTVSDGDWALQAWHTPGHMGGHLCFAMGDTLFSGDHVMDWSSTIVAPPDGDMAAYMASLDRLTTRPWQRFLPGHGDPVAAPAQRLAYLTQHRRQREAAILSALGSEAADAAAIAAKIYTDIPAHLLPAASRNVLAHLVDLWERNVIRTAAPLRPQSIFEIR